MLRTIFRLFAVVVFVSLFAVSPAVQAGPSKVKVAWEEKVKGKIEIFKVLEKNNHVFIKSEERLWLYDGESGKELWKAELKKYVAGGLDLMLAEDFYLATTKLGMVLIELATGQEKWVCDLKAANPKSNPKKYTDYGKTDKGLVLQFADVFVSINMADGKILWSQKLKGVESWSFFGDNILAVKAKSGLLVNTETGATIKEIKEKFSKDYYWFYEVDGNILVFLKDGAKYIKSSDGTEVWAIDDEVDNFKEIYKFKAKGETYGVLTLDKQLAIFNMTTGEVVRTKPYHKKDNPEGVRGNILEIRYFEDEDLIGVYTTKRFIIATKGGCHLNYYKINRATGEVVKRNHIVSCQMSVSARPVEPVQGATSIAGAISQGFKSMWKQPPVEMKEIKNSDDGRVLLVYGTTVVDPTDVKTPAEGLYKINETTGEIVWKTLFKYEDGWSYNVKKELIEPIIAGDVMYIYSGDRVRAFNIDTGAKLWESEARQWVDNIHLQDRQLFVSHGVFREWLQDGKPKSRKNKPFGLMVINAADGTTLWAKEKLGERLGFDMPTTVDSKTGKVYYSDGEVLAAVDMKSGAPAWEYNLKKAKLGDYITPYGAAGGNFFVDGIIMLGTKKIARIGLADGNEIWNVKWKFKGTDMSIPPTFIQGQMIYEIGKTVYSYDVGTGEAKWMSKHGKMTTFVISPNQKYLYAYEGKQVQAIDLTD